MESRLSFSDAVCEDFGKLMVGVKEGETRTGKVTVADGVGDEEVRGKELEASFHVVEVFKRELPKLTRVVPRRARRF